MRFKLRLMSLTIGLSLFLGLMSSSLGQERKNRLGSLKAAEELQGTIRVSGAWALYPMLVKWGEEFRKAYPNIRVDISAGGAGKGVADALAGLVNIGMVSRDISPEEVKQSAVYVPVVKDAVFPMMNEANPILPNGLSRKGIKKQTFLDLWIKGRGMTWGEIVQTGSQSTDAKYRVNVYTRSDSCGAAETWAQYLGKKKQEDLQGIGVYGDPGLAEAVRKDPLGIGYNNLNYAFDLKTGLPPKGLRVVPVDLNENGKIDPEEDLPSKSRAIQAIASGVYPSPPARDLYLLTKDGFKGLTREFIQWILTEGQKYVDETGYIQLKKTQVSAALRMLGN
ncbi:MAG TPA: substrate-binding domain-containing protein [Thermodesulfobacteriota bacterium]|nr:substrate-binding domain-containing protein [Thermodesulfobacteriota bacterium]